MHYIDYAHFRDHVVYHGSVSDLDGAPKSTWSYEKNGQKVSHDQPIDPARFRALWNGIIKLGAFKRNKVRDPERVIDIVGNHIVGIIFKDGDATRQQMFMIPADEDDAEFVKWLKALNVPKGSNAPGPEPTHRATAAEYLHRLKISSAPKPPPEEEPPRKVSRLAAIREKVLPAFFGPEYTVHPDESGEKPAIEILVFEPGTSEQGTERDYTTLVTSGLSDARMPVPEGSPYHRAELLMYVEEPDLTHANVMQWLARLPHQQKTTWYSPGTTMSNGNPPQPIFEDSELDCFLFLSSIVGNDDKVHEELVLDGDPVLMLWVVLITHAERQFIIERGLDDFMNVLDENKHSFVLDEGRKSFVEPDE